MGHLILTTSPWSILTLITIVSMHILFKNCEKIFWIFSLCFRDIETGSTCSLDPQTNLPDENCVFIPIGDNSAIKSSYMAAPFLESVDHFCKNTEQTYHHDIYKPTKHNSTMWIFLCLQLGISQKMPLFHQNTFMKMEI